MRRRLIVLALLAVSCVPFAPETAKANDAVCAQPTVVGVGLPRVCIPPIRP